MVLAIVLRLNYLIFKLDIKEENLVVKSIDVESNLQLKKGFFVAKSKDF